MGSWLPRFSSISGFEQEPGTAGVFCPCPDTEGLREPRTPRLGEAACRGLPSTCCGFVCEACSCAPHARHQPAPALGATSLQMAHTDSQPGTQESLEDREPSGGSLPGQLPEQLPWARRDAGAVLRRELKPVT